MDPKLYWLISISYQHLLCKLWDLSYVHIKPESCLDKTCFNEICIVHIRCQFHKFHACFYGTRINVVHLAQNYNISILFGLVSIFKPFEGEGLSSVWRPDSICAIFGTRRIVCKFWIVLIALAAAAVKFRGDVLPNILLSTHRR